MCGMLIIRQAKESGKEGGKIFPPLQGPHLGDGEAIMQMEQNSLLP